MSMLEIKNEKLSEALRKLRELYPDDSLGDAIIMAVDRIKKAEERCKELNRTALEAGARAYEFDKRYCDILVEKRQLENTLNKINEQLVRFVDTNEPETKKLEEMEK